MKIFANILAMSVVLTGLVAMAKPIKVAITVDDITMHGDILSTETRLDITNKFIEVFKKHKITNAYGFVNAKKVEEHPDTKSSLDAWVKAGLPIGNHTYSHISLTKNTAADFIENIHKGEPLLKEYVKDDSYKWFRYPYLHEGDTLEKRNAVRDELKKMNYQIAPVSIDFEDWAWNNPYVRCKTANNEKEIKWLEKSYVQNSLNRLKYAQASAKKLFGRDINHILLLHIGTFDSKMLDRLLTAYENAGVEFISLPDANKDPAYSEDLKMGVTYGYDFLTQLMVARKIDKPEVEELPFKKLESLCK